MLSMTILKSAQELRKKRKNSDQKRIYLTGGTNKTGISEQIPKKQYKRTLCGEEKSMTTHQEK
jgi:hypothetical protein